MAETKMQLVDWLDDLCVRFIINLPREELESVERICFQVEEAQWFYEDFVRPLDPNLPSLNLKQFCLKIFQHCPLFSVYDQELHSKAFSEFLAYKTRVPVRGAILLSDALDEVVLVKGWKKGSSWSFPRGKINKDEKDIDCAIREVYEETGYDIRLAGLIVKEEEVKSIDITMREQNMKLFVFPGVPMDTHFEPRTRKEISKIEWFKLSDLPTLKKLKQQQQQQQQQSGQDLAKNANKFYMVAPFLVPLKKYIAHLRKRNGSVSQVTHQEQLIQGVVPKIQDNRFSVPVVETGALQTNSDMGRLMTQLRQSQQAARESNFPEVSVPTLSADDASMSLRSLLHLPTVPASATKNKENPADLRENKANAMLSLLRGNPPNRNVEPPPQTPFEQLVDAPSRPPASPKRHTLHSDRAPGFSKPPIFPFSPSQVPNGPLRQPGTSPTHPKELARDSFENQHPASSQPLQFFHQQTVPHQRTATLNERTSDPQPLPDSQIVGDRQNIGPPASKLPMPKLNAHSSALLNLFRTTSSKLAEDSPLAQLPAENAVNPPELSASRPTTVFQSQHPFSKPTLPSTVGTTSALVSSLPGVAPKASPRSTSQHQENLLSLFKSPMFSGKTSPSLAPPPAPVELAASQPALRVRSLPPEIQNESGDTATLLHAEPNITKKRPKESLDFSKTNLSATVTGPLNVPQFESIQKSSGKRAQSILHPNPAQSGSKEIQQPIRILTRPGSSHKATSEADAKATKIVEPRRSPRHTFQKQRSKVSQDASPKPFQPQILKRPAGTRSPVQAVGNQALQSQQEPQPPKILTRPTNLEGRSQSTEQKAALLSLFGRSSSNLSSTGPPVGLPVSPLSEKPAIDNGLISPTGVPRSRIGSVQSLEGDSLTTGGRQTPKSTVSPHDKKFLLGFLDDVAREGRK